MACPRPAVDERPPASPPPSARNPTRTHPPRPCAHPPSLPRRIQKAAPDRVKALAALAGLLAEQLNTVALMLVGGNLLPLSDVVTHALDCDEPPAVGFGGIRSIALGGGGGCGGGQSSGGGAPPRLAAATVPDEHWHWAFSELQLDPEQVSARVCEGRGCLLQGARPLGARVSPLPPPPPLTCALVEGGAAKGGAFSVVGAHWPPPRAHRGAAAGGGRRARLRPSLAWPAPQQLPRPPSAPHPPARSLPPTLRAQTLPAPARPSAPPPTTSTSVRR
jgi:hypothetical protein